MASGYYSLPAFRAPSGLDFSPINSAIDDLVTAREKNRLLTEQRQLGEALASQPQGNSAPAPYAEPTNKLLSPRMSPAQSSAAAAGRAMPVASPGDPNLPAGMRNNNPGNIKYIPGAKYAGLVGPSQNTDQGDPQMVFDTPQSGMKAASELAMRKYQGGKRTAMDLIAGNMGWTPGNTSAAANIARTMGVQPNEDLRLDDPNRMQAFLKALTLQEHGAASKRYGDDVYSVVGGRAQPASSAPAPTSRASGMNYAAGIQKALQQGNIALANQLRNAQQEEEATAYNRQRQGTQDAMAAESQGLTIQSKREELQQNAVKKIGAIAQVIQSQTDPAKKAQMWQRFMASDPSFGPDLQAMGVDPSDVEAGTQMLIAKAGGNSKKTGTTVQYYTDPADGKLKPWVVTETGEFKAVNTPGQVAPTVKTVDQGTSTAILGPGGVQVQPALPKDVEGEARAKEVGKGEGTRVAEQPAVENSMRGSISGLDRLVAETKSLKEAPGLNSMTGVIQGSGFVPNVFQSTADAQAKLETLKSQVAFNVLQAMRDASKTGGALGGIAVEELRMLQNNLASLDTSQGEEAFKQSLDRIADYAEGAKIRLLQGYRGTYGRDFNGAAAQANPQIDALKSKYGLE